jgi:hypothetical protein
MSDFKGTPGPWKVAGPFDIKGGGRCLSIEAEVPEGTLTVATVGFNSDDDTEACRADADLIAQAPFLRAERVALRAENERLRAQVDTLRTALRTVHSWLPTPDISRAMAEARDVAYVALLRTAPEQPRRDLNLLAPVVPGGVEESGGLAQPAGKQAVKDGVTHATVSDAGGAKLRACNRHVDCDAADARARERGHIGADHCHDDSCEDCFGT